jgi:hypothetical protein
MWRLGFPLELATSFGQTAKDVVTAAQSPTGQRPQRPLDAAAREGQVRAMADFGASALRAWQAAGVLATYRLRVVGLLHGLAFLMRTQKQFQEQMSIAAGSLSSVLLFSAPDTQKAALDLFEALGEELSRLGRAGSQRVAQAHAEGSAKLGSHFAAWHATARREVEGG